MDEGSGEVTASCKTKQIDVGLMMMRFKGEEAENCCKLPPYHDIVVLYKLESTQRMQTSAEPVSAC